MLNITTVKVSYVSVNCNCTQTISLFPLH